MENLIMKLCRETKGYPLHEVAKKLGATTAVYKAIECGDILMTREQAEQLGALYDIKPAYFYEQALQIDLLATRAAIIRVIKNQCKTLEQRIKDGLLAAEHRVIIGQRMKNVRIERGEAVSAAAKAGGISRRNLARIEAGERDFRIVTLHKICKHYKVDIRDMFKDLPKWT